MDGETLAAAIAISRGSGGGSFAPDISDPQDGDTLVYDASEEKWVNGSGGGGSGGGSFVIHDDGTGTLDKTWKEIHDALVAGMYVTIISTFENETYSEMVVSTMISSDEYQIANYTETYYKTDSENGYPVLSQ